MNNLAPFDIDIDFATMTVWQEARGQGAMAWELIAQVIKNRTERKYFSDGTCTSTCLWPYQFSGWSNSTIRMKSALWLRGSGDQDPRVESVRGITHSVLAGALEIPYPWIYQALCYYSPAAMIGTPAWAEEMDFLGAAYGFRFYAPRAPAAA